MPSSKSVPYRQIRAKYDSETITVYQAYNSAIAEAAVLAQKLSASEAFKPSRTTWIKPSWSWMMYRAGYSYKDPGQERILALKMKHEHFLQLLKYPKLSHAKASDLPGIKPAKSSDYLGKVVVQWDPERTPKLGKLPYRSIQIGISADVSKTWVDEWIVEIEDVTDTARALKDYLASHPGAGVEELVEKQLHPLERVYELPKEMQILLEMDKEE